MSYSWRRVAQDRWLCINDDCKLIVGAILKEGVRRYRIQLRCSGGTLLLHPVIFSHFGTAGRILLSKLKELPLHQPEIKHSEQSDSAIAATSVES
jgi:hypothetical protein